MPDIGAFVRILSNNWSAYLGGAAALGVFTMAILQTVKDLSPVRRVFQRAHLRAWFATKCGKGLASVVEQQLVELATDGDANAFYDLPIEQLCGQMTAAAQVAVEDPSGHQDLLRCLARNVPPNMFDDLTSQHVPLRVAFNRLKADGSKAAQDQAQALAEAKARLTHQIQRSIDAFQIGVSYRWKLLFQILAFGLSVVIALVATTGTGFGHRMFVAITAGFLAPLARDLQARLQQVK